MLQSIPLRLQLDEAQRLRGAIEEPWQKDHREVMQAWDWEFIIARCLQVAEGLELGWAITCQEVAAGAIKDLKEREQSLRTVFDAIIDVVRLAHEKATAFAQATGHLLDRLGELTSAITELERKREKYLFRLSLIDAAVLADARAEHADGSYPSPGAALADLLAARHAARITPTYGQLRQWADRSPPPSGWYEEEDVPV